MNIRDVFNAALLAAFLSLAACGGGGGDGGSDPGGTDPGGTDPGGTDPGGTDPGGTDPGGTGPTGNKPPQVTAGADQTEINEGVTVKLSASVIDEDKATLKFKWESPSGVTLSDAAVANPSFVAPDVSKETKLAFAVVVTDSKGASAKASVTITVRDVLAVASSEWDTMKWDDGKWN